MIEYFLITGCIALLLFVYFFAVKPMREIAWYKKVLEEAGYRVKVLPFAFLGAGIFKYIQKDQNKHGDSHYGLKRELTNYDISISNLLDIISIDIISPEVLKEFYKPDVVYKYEKLPMFVENLRRVMGNGMSFTEGDQWKRRRKIMNNIFNYDFITANIPQISRIFDETFDRAERKAKINPSKEEYY